MQRLSMARGLVYLVKMLNAVAEMPMTRERIVIVGGDAAGMSAASQARRRRPDLEIVVFERTDFTSYSN